MLLNLFDFIGKVTLWLRRFCDSEWNCLTYTLIFSDLSLLGNNFERISEIYFYRFLIRFFSKFGRAPLLGSRLKHIIWISFNIFNLKVKIVRIVLIILNRNQIAFSTHYLLNLRRQTIFAQIFETWDAIIYAWVIVFRVLHLLIVYPLLQRLLVLLKRRSC